MFKKAISIVLIFCLLVVSVPAASAETESTPSQSIEEILTEYHTKTFNALTAENGTAAAYSRSTNGDVTTLEQETVEQLTTAGYEAYNVTASNYTALEEELQTNFSDIGLDPNSSYIVVVSGDEENAPSSPGARVVDPPSYEDYDGGSSSTFTYTYNGTTYLMRYITLTSASATELQKNTRYSLSHIPNVNNYAADILDASLALGIDEVTRSPLSTVLTLLGNWTTDDNLTLMQPGDIDIYANTLWTREYIQVWNSVRGVWYTAQCSSYADSKAKCVGGYVYNAATNTSTFITGPEYNKITYSVKFNQKTQRKIDAAIAYLRNQPNNDFVGNINFYFVNENNEILFRSSNSPLFTHYENHSILYPLEEEG